MEEDERIWNGLLLPVLSGAIDNIHSIRGFGRVDYISCHLFPSVDCFAYTFFCREPPLCSLSLSLPTYINGGMAGRLAMTSKHEMDHSVWWLPVAAGRQAGRTRTRKKKHYITTHGSSSSLEVVGYFAMLYIPPSSSFPPPNQSRSPSARPPVPLSPAINPGRPSCAVSGFSPFSLVLLRTYI